MSGQWVVDVSEQTFEKEVLERSRQVPVVVDFWAEWCGPCRILGPILEKLADEYNGKFVLAKVDTERAPQLSQFFGIRSIPMVMAFKDGQPVAEFTGALPEATVREFLEKLTPSEEEGKLARADSLKEDDPEQAVTLYREVLEDEPANDRASVGLAEVLLNQGDHDEARTIVNAMLPAAGPYAERIEHLRSELVLHELSPESNESDLRRRLEENPGDAGALLELGQVLASQKQYSEALESLFRAAELDRELASGKAKKLMVDIFHVIGVRSELADDYRTRLSRLLY